MSNHKKFSTDEELELIAYYKSHSDDNTARTFHCHFNPTVIRILDKYNIDRHTKEENKAFRSALFSQATRREFDSETEQQIITYYINHSDTATAHEFKTKAYVIHRVLDKYKIERHTHEENIALGLQKCKATCMQHFGTESPQQAEIVKKKTAETNLKKYGNKCSLHDNGEIQKKAAQTKLEKYGAENPFASEVIREKIKNTNLIKYGTTSYSKTNEYKFKVAQTCLIRYGETSYQKTVEAAKTHRKLYVYNQEYFDSFPELCFYLWHVENNYTISRCPIKFDYIYNGVLHSYVPDFLVCNELIEIKGNHFRTASGTWCNPFDHTQDGLYDAKYKCALKNNVKILYQNDYQKYIDWFYIMDYKKEDFITK